MINLNVTLMKINNPHNTTGVCWLEPPKKKTCMLIAMITRNVTLVQSPPPSLFFMCRGEEGVFLKNLLFGSFFSLFNWIYFVSVFNKKLFYQYGSNLPGLFCNIGPGMNPVNKHLCTILPIILVIIR